MTLFGPGGSIESEYTTRIIKYKALLEQGALTESEYQELVAILLDISNIKNNLSNEKDCRAAEQIIRSLRSWAGILPK